MTSQYRTRILARVNHRRVTESLQVSNYRTRERRAIDPLTGLGIQRMSDVPTQPPVSAGL
jgi:PleD family two-component response regulator